MTKKKNILAIIGSASTNSANQKIVEIIASLTREIYNWKVYNDLKSLPHFDPILSIDNPPNEIIEFRQYIEQSDGIIICTPEYVFSIPSGLKNAIEWCISTTLFADKPIGLITASASGQKGHEELQLIMKTVMAKFTSQTVLLISGVKGKIDKQDGIIDPETKRQLDSLMEAFRELIDE